MTRPSCALNWMRSQPKWTNCRCGERACNGADFLKYWSFFWDCTEGRGNMGSFMRKFRTTEDESYLDCTNLWKDQCCQGPRLMLLFLRPRRRTSRKRWAASVKRDVRCAPSWTPWSASASTGVVCRIKLPWVDPVTILNGHNLYNFRYLYEFNHLT